MTTDTPRRGARPASGTEAPPSAAVPSGNAEKRQPPARRNTTPSLPLPGLPFGIDSKRLLWYGGLAGLAAVGILEWPVAAVVGVGTYVAERMAREDASRAERQHS